MDSNPVLSTGSKCENEISETAGSRNITSKPAEAEIRSLYVYDEQGFLVQASEGGSTYQYERDTEGNTLRKSACGRTLYEAAYDACGRITMLDGTRYQYDKAGRLQQAESEHGIRAVCRYNKNGMQREVICGNGLRTTYGYDSRNQLISLNAGFEGKKNRSVGVCRRKR